MTLSHLPASTSDAYDITVMDTLPTQAGAVVVDYTTATSTCTGFANSYAAPVVTFTVTHLPLGTTCTITYTVTVNDKAVAGSTYANNAALTYDSFPGTGGRPDTAGPVTQSFTTGVPTIVKSITATSLPETGTTQHTGLDDVNVGETVTYQMLVTLKEGTTPTTVVDNLPNVMTVVSSRVVSIGANISGSLLAAGAAGTASDSNYTTDGKPDRVTFSFGTLINDRDNINDAKDQIVLEVVARVDENAINMDGLVLTNIATLNYGAGSVNDSKSVEVVEPVLVTQKTAPVVTGRPGDLIDYTVTVSHAPTSTGPAYDLVITDPMLPKLHLVAGSVTTTMGTVTTGNGGTDTTIHVDVPILNLGQTVTITYQAQVDGNTVPPVDLINVATTNYDSAPGTGGRTGTVKDDHTIRVNQDTYQYAKTVVDTSFADTGTSAYTPAPDVTIGETATYEIVAYLPEGTTSPFIITDNLPNGMSVVSSQVMSIGANISGSLLNAGDPGVASDVNLVDGNNDRVVFSFGTVNNVVDGVDDAKDQVIVRIVARVFDATTAGLNADGQLKTNIADIGYGPNHRPATANIDVVEPNIKVEKTFSPKIEGRGHTLTLTFVLTNTGGSTAYDVAFTDPLSPLLRLDALQIDSSAAPGTTATDSTPLGGYGTLMNVAFDQLAPGAKITMVATVTINPTTQPYQP